ncbi:helix-turn-helix domain-containing protein [Anaeromyxobacter paludicola]
MPQVAALLQVCRATVHKLIDRGDLQHVRVSGAIRVPVRALRAYLERRK